MQCPSDTLPTWCFKECAATVAPFIMRILNLSLTSGDFPSPLKHAIVTPLLKKAGLDDSNVSCYRPVSKFSTLIKKILERIFNCQVISHFEEAAARFSISLSFWQLNWDGCPQGLLGSYRCHLKWKICYVVSIRSNYGIRHGRPQHLAVPSRDNVRLPWRATSMNALILRWLNPVYSSWRQIDCPMASGICRTSRLCLGATST